MSKIMLVDDNEVIIDLYERTIENISDAEVVAVAKNGEEAIEILENNVENIESMVNTINSLNTENIENKGEILNVKK